MAKKRASSRPGLRSSRSPEPRPSDPVSRLGRFLQFMSLGLVAAAIFLPFPNPIRPPTGAALPWDFFPSPYQNAAVLAVHTNVPWTILSLLSLVASVVAYRSRRARIAGRPVVICTLAVVLVICAHGVALGYLQSQGPLRIELHGPAPAGLEITLAPSTGTAPAEFHAQAITRLTFREGTSEQWRLLFAGDALFAVPVLLLWLLRLAVKKIAKTNPTLLQ